MNSFFKGKRIFVTGACGTVGSELIRQLIEEYEIHELIAIDNNESELFFVEQRFSKYSNCSFYLADVRDKDKLSRMLKNIHIVFHTAAFKHVILCERSPFEAVQTNIIGVQNLISASSENHVEKVVFTSSDKAVNPTSVMGTSKLMGERLMTAANSNYSGSDTRFISTRFGNVLGSRGSVIPIFREQIRLRKSVTLTDPGMTRFIMSIKEAVRLVIESAFLALGGEVFITKMPVIKIQDLAEVMIEELAPYYGHAPEDIRIEIIGAKAGEKMYEELMGHEETRRAMELERYFVVLPAFSYASKALTHEYQNVISRSVNNPYNSGNEEPLSKEQLSKFLKINNLLVEDLSERQHPAERFWPEVGSATKDE
jgi:FlaA1/EpsC-like NDP-sugar epimerase